jgi:outer membrane protein, heavy metal efflux system
MLRSLVSFSIAMLTALVCVTSVPAQEHGPTQQGINGMSAPSALFRRSATGLPTGRAPTSVTEISEQLPELAIVRTITFREFMRKVESSNLALAAQRYNVPIARAMLVASRVYPDPQLQVGGGGDITGQGQVNTVNAGINQEVVLGGKIGAREDAARATLKSTDAGVADYLRNLRGQAADAFIDGVIGVLKLQREYKGYDRSRQLVQINQERMKKGEISEDEMLRTRIAELEAHSDLFDSQSYLHQTLAGLMGLMGEHQSEGLIAPVGNLEQPPRDFSLEDLTSKAVANRYDVVAARYALESAQAQYRLARANRIPDPIFGAEYDHFTKVTNPIDPSPTWDAIVASITVPIPLSNLNHGNVDAAYYQVLQNQKALEAAQLQAEIDVRTAYQHYRLAVTGTQEFGGELMRDADNLYKSKLFKLEKGSVGLIEVLDAHQALDQLYMDYYNALKREAQALVNLEQAAGIWDVDF